MSEELELGALGLDGRASSALDGLSVHVAGGFPGERVVAELLSRSRHRPELHARALRVLRAHPARRRAPCARHASNGGDCTGCTLMELDEAAQRSALAATLDALGLGVGHVEADGRELGYRWSSKRVVGEISGRVVLGSYVQNTHQLADMAGCLVDHPAIARAADAIADRATSLGVRAYDEATRGGELRYVWLKTDGEHVLVTLVGATAPSPALRALGAALDDVALGVAHAVQRSSGNAVRGGDAAALHGAQRLALQLSGEVVEVGPLGFLQPNAPLAQRCYETLLVDERGALLGGEVAFDLYAGAGVTTRALRRSFARVVPCENYRESALALGIEPEGVGDFLDRQVLKGARPDLVVANPPRSGLGARVVEALGALGAARVHVMSCSAASLAVDLQGLRAHGYALVGLQAFDTLPQTPHVELVAKLAHAATSD